jgi:nucleoside-diphosphate-sugar epimerase
VRVVIGRASDFYGPGVLKSLAGEESFRAVIAGNKAMWAGRLDVPHTMTFIADFARGLIALAERDAALGQVWHFGDAGALTGREFLQMAFQAAGKSPNIGVYSPMMIRMVGLFSPMVREVTENIYQYEKPFVVDGSKFVKTFGFEYTPHQEGIERAVEWYKNMYPATDHEKKSAHTGTASV